MSASQVNKLTSRRFACQVDIILLPLQGVCLLLHLYIPKVSLRLPWAMYVSRLPFQGVCFVICPYFVLPALLLLTMLRFQFSVFTFHLCHHSLFAPQTVRTASVLRLTCAAPADDAFGYSYSICMTVCPAAWSVSFEMFSMVSLTVCHVGPKFDCGQSG